MGEPTAILARLLCGIGMRLMETMSFRIKDMDLDRHVIKMASTALPESEKRFSSLISKVFQAPTATNTGTTRYKLNSTQIFTPYYATPL